MQSAIKLAACGLMIARFSKVGNLGVLALGVGHDDEGLGDYGALRADSVTSTVSDLTNTADFSTVSTFAAIPPEELTSQALETYKRRMETVGPDTVTSTRTTTATATVTAKPSAAMSTEAAPVKDTVTAAAPLDTSAPGVFTSVVTSYYQFTKTWQSVVTQTIVGTVGPSTTSANSTQAVATSTSDFDGISGTATGTGAFSPGVSSGYATSTVGTTLYPSTTNGTWTAPVATPTGPVISGAMSIKMAGAHIIGAAAVAAMVYIF